MKIDIKTTKNPDVVQITCTDERWYQHKATGEIVPSSTWIAGCYPKGIGFYKWLAEHGWDEAESIKNEAGEKGSKVHLCIERLLAGDSIRHDEMLENLQTKVLEEISVSEYEAVVSFRDWFAETHPGTISTESVLFNFEHGYAGTMDYKCTINGEVWLIDFKTSQYIWPSHELQLSSYKHSPENADVEKMAILQIGYQRNKKKYKFTEVEDKFELFLAAKMIWKNENENVHPKQYEFPQSITLKKE